MSNGFKSPYSTSYYTVPSPLHEQIFSNKLARHTILSGAIRTGKSRAAFVRFIQEILRQYKAEKHIKKTFCIVARSRASLKYNILDNLFSWLPHRLAAQFPTSQHSSGCTLLNGMISIRYFPTETESDMSRLMGCSLQGLLVDEVAYCTHTMYAKLTSRLTGIKGSKFDPFIISTCNPEGISHWLNQNYILPSERGEVDPSIIKSYRFELNHETCPFLPASTIENLTHEYRAVPSLYRRFIEGIWSSSQGAVFGMLDNSYIDDQLPILCSQFYIGLDVGYSAPTAAVLIGVLPTTYMGISRVSIIDAVQFTTSDINLSSAEYRANMIIDMIGNRRINCIIYDSANPEQAVSLDHSLRNKGVQISFYPSDKKIQEGLELLQLSIASRRLMFTTKGIKAYHCFCELEYSDKDRASIVIKPGSNDHIFDAVRYAVMQPAIRSVLERRG